MASEESSVIFLLLQRPPISTLFPYSSLFLAVRSGDDLPSCLPPTYHPPRRTTACVSPTARASFIVTSRDAYSPRSEEHTSELQSRQYIVCRLLLENKNTSLSSAYSSHTMMRL